MRLFFPCLTNDFTPTIFPGCLSHDLENAKPIIMVKLKVKKSVATTVATKSGRSDHKLSRKRSERNLRKDSVQSPGAKAIGAETNSNSHLNSHANHQPVSSKAP